MSKNIATTILPSFYVIEIEGDAVETVMPGNFNIDKVSIGSRDFTNDLDALAALSNAMAFVVANPALDDSNASEVVDYNPEFFPTMKFTPEVEQEQAAIDDAVDDITNMIGPNEIAVPMTRLFDPLGDFVEVRWVIDAPTFNIKGRVAVNPDKYISLKAQELSEKNGPPQLKSKPAQIHLH